MQTQTTTRDGPAIFFATLIQFTLNNGYLKCFLLSSSISSWTDTHLGVRVQFANKQTNKQAKPDREVVEFLQA